jgi:hypothetical protein
LIHFHHPKNNLLKLCFFFLLNCFFTSCGFAFVGATSSSSSSLSALSSTGEASCSGNSSSPTSGFYNKLKILFF